MAIQVKINSVDKTNTISKDSLIVNLNLNNLVDTAKFKIIKKGVTPPVFSDDIEVSDGAVKIFGGKIISVNQLPLSNAEGIQYDVNCIDHSWEFDKLLATKTYESKTVAFIVDDLITTYAPTFTSVNVTSTTVIDKIVFNQQNLSQCIKRIADILQYYYYIDVDKDVHLFAKNVKSAPFKLTDDTTDLDYGKYVVNSLKIKNDGSQVVNRIKVAGGEYDADSFTDTITVNGNDTLSFNVPYRFGNFSVKLNTVAQTVGIDGSDDFVSYDVLYNIDEKTFRFETALSDADVLEFTGNPKRPVFGIAEDGASIGLYGKIEKLIIEPSIQDLASARSRATAELLSYALSIVDAQARTLESGLSAGQTITINNTRFGVSDNLVIKQITFSQYGHDSFQYSLDLVSTKRYTLIEMLQDILTPEQKPIDESIVPTELQLDKKGITVTESIEVVNPEDDDASIEVTETYNITLPEPSWVLGDYKPTSITDTKRNGLLDISMELY